MMLTASLQMNPSKSPVLDADRRDGDMSEVHVEDRRTRDTRKALLVNQREMKLLRQEFVNTALLGSRIY